jgi:hypothetical protein
MNDAVVVLSLSRRSRRWGPVHDLHPCRRPHGNVSLLSRQLSAIQQTPNAIKTTKSDDRGVTVPAAMSALPRANGGLNGSFYPPDGSLYTPFWQVRA